MVTIAQQEQQSCEQHQAALRVALKLINHFSTNAANCGVNIINDGTNTFKEVVVPSEELMNRAMLCLPTAVEQHKLTAWNIAEAATSADLEGAYDTKHLRNGDSLEGLPQITYKNGELKEIKFTYRCK